MNATLDSAYNPGALFNLVMKKFRLKNDAELASVLGVPPPVISAIRHRRLPVGAPLLIRAHEVTGMNTRDLRFLMGDNRPKFQLYSRGEGGVITHWRKGSRPSVAKKGGL